MKMVEYPVIAGGSETTLNELFTILREELGVYDPAVTQLSPVYGAIRPGDIPHSLASIEKARTLLDYNPQYSVKSGLKEAARWYYENLK